MANPLDLNRPVQLRDGRQARVICMNLDNRYPIVVAFRGSDNKEYISVYSLKGEYERAPVGRETDSDLINIPIEMFVHVGIHFINGIPCSVAKHTMVEVANWYELNSIKPDIIQKITWVK